VSELYDVNGVRCCGWTLAGRVLVQKDAVAVEQGARMAGEKRLAKALVGHSALLVSMASGVVVRIYAMLLRLLRALAVYRQLCRGVLRAWAWQVAAEIVPHPMACTNPSHLNDHLQKLESS